MVLVSPMTVLNFPVTKNSEHSWRMGRKVGNIQHVLLSIMISAFRCLNSVSIKILGRQIYQLDLIMNCSGIIGFSVDFLINQKRKKRMKKQSEIRFKEKLVMNINFNTAIKNYISERKKKSIVYDFITSLPTCIRYNSCSLTSVETSLTRFREHSWFVRSAGHIFYNYNIHIKQDTNGVYCSWKNNSWASGFIEYWEENHPNSVLYQVIFPFNGNKVAFFSASPEKAIHEKYPEILINSVLNT